LFDIPKAHGAAFSKSRESADRRLCWIAGEHLLTFYESSPGNSRGFCRVRGLPSLSNFDADISLISSPLSALDDDPCICAEMHVYVASKAPWFTISDDLPQFSALPR
jgi:hypothetical protein